MLVVGGGAAGLLTAWALRHLGDRLCIVDRAASWGGKVQAPHKTGLGALGMPEDQTDLRCLVSSLGIQSVAAPTEQLFQARGQFGRDAEEFTGLYNVEARLAPSTLPAGKHVAAALTGFLLNTSAVNPLTGATPKQHPAAECSKHRTLGSYIEAALGADAAAYLRDTLTTPRADLELETDVCERLKLGLSGEPGAQFLIRGGWDAVVGALVAKLQAAGVRMFLDGEVSCVIARNLTSLRTALGPPQAADTTGGVRVAAADPAAAGSSQGGSQPARGSSAKGKDDRDRGKEDRDKHKKDKDRDDKHDRHDKHEDKDRDDDDRDGHGHRQRHTKKNKSRREGRHHRSDDDADASGSKRPRPSPSPRPRRRSAARASPSPSPKPRGPPASAKKAAAPARPGSSAPSSPPPRFLALGSKASWSAQRLVLAITPADMRNLGGSLGQLLAANPNLNSLVGVETVHYTAVYGTRWWEKYGALAGASLAYTAADDAEADLCTELSEFPSAAAQQGINATRPVFSSQAACVQRWRAIHSAGGLPAVRAAAAQALEKLFPGEAAIPPPLHDAFVVQPGSWHALAAGASRAGVTAESVAEFARDPAGDASMCLVGEAFALQHAGSVQGAWKSAAKCLGTSFESLLDAGAHDELLRIGSGCASMAANGTLPTEARLASSAAGQGLNPITGRPDEDEDEDDANTDSSDPSIWRGDGLGRDDPGIRMPGSDEAEAEADEDEGGDDDDDVEAEFDGVEGNEPSGTLTRGGSDAEFDAFADLHALLSASRFDALAARAQAQAQAQAQSADGAAALTTPAAGVPALVAGNLLVRTNKGGTTVVVGDQAASHVIVTGLPDRSSSSSASSSASSSS